MNALFGAWAAWNLLLVIPVLVFSIEVIVAALGRRRAAVPAASGKLVRNVVLMPAHDEEAGIGATVRAVRRSLGPGDDLLVVADNCSDATAAAARREGASVIERTDPALRGKSYALDYGIRNLATNPPDVVTVIDADCEIDPDSLREIGVLAAATGRPAQALYLMHAPPGTGVRGRIAEFAWRVKNQVRPLGLSRLGFPCHLTGSGMAFPWPVISRARIASGHVVEDLQLGLDLALAGAAPLFVPDATVHSRFAANASGASSQRTRWEHGHLHLLASQAPRLLWRSIAGANAGLLGLALDLLVPPLALLVLLVGANFAIGVLLAATTRLPLAPLWIASASLTLLALAVFIAWRVFARNVVSAADLLGAPLYALRKIPLYLKFLWAREKRWVRASRDGSRHE